MKVMNSFAMYNVIFPSSVIYGFELSKSTKQCHRFKFRRRRVLYRHSHHMIVSFNP